MRTRTTAAVMLAFALLAGAATPSVAKPITFNFTFVGGGATATGFITFESTLLPNPGDIGGPFPNPAVLALQVTVSGATAGNGTFGIGSFSGVSFNTGDAALDLTRQLVGQPTPGGPWGTPAMSSADFNLFGTGAPAPRGIAPFTLGANDGEANEMVLTSMAPVTTDVAAVPALDDWNLAALALLVGGVGVVLLRRRHFARWSR